jgi:hypothetical protein
VCYMSHTSLIFGLITLIRVIEAFHCGTFSILLWCPPT